MQKAVVLKSGKGNDSKFWSLLETNINGQKVHALAETVKIFNLNSELQLQPDSLRKFNWMPFSEIKHNNVEKDQIFLPGVLSLNSKFNFGLYEGIQLGIVYSFDPTYIEWCLFNVPFFQVFDLDELQSYGIVRINTRYNHREFGTTEIIPLINSFANIQEICKKIGMANLEFRLNTDAVETNRRNIENRNHR